MPHAGHGFVAQFHEEIASVVALIGPQRDRLRAIGVWLDQRQRCPPRGMAQSARGHRADNQTVAVLHQRVTQETQPLFFARALAEEAGVGVGGRGVRLILPALAVEVAFGVAPRARRLARGILYAEALRGSPTLPTACHQPRSDRSTTVF